jgi:hypothetical protein
LGQDVGDCGREEEEAFGELEGDVLGAAGSYSVNGFMDFEVVVRRKETNSVVDIRVLEDGGGDVVESASSSSGLGDCELIQYISRRISTGLTWFSHLE